MAATRGVSPTANRPSCFSSFGISAYHEPSILGKMPIFSLLIIGPPCDQSVEGEYSSHAVRLISWHLVITGTYRLADTILPSAFATKKSSSEPVRSETFFIMKLLC